MSDKKPEKDPNRERRRRRREEEEEKEKKGGAPQAQPQEERRRRRREEEAAGAAPAPAGEAPRERRRRREEQQQQQDPTPAEKPAERRRSSVPPEKAEKAEKEKPQKTEKETANGKKLSETERTFNLSSAAYSRMRRYLDKYEKSCAFHKLLEKMLTEQYMQLLGLSDSDEAKSDKERCKLSDAMNVSADPKVSSAHIMTNFYSGVLEFGKMPIPADLRQSVDVLEREYKEAKKAEKGRREEKERHEREAKVAEVEETVAEPEEDEEYDDDFEDDDFVDPDAEKANKIINQQMQREYEDAKQQRKDRTRDSRVGTPKKDTTNQGIVLAERKGMSHAEVLKGRKLSAERTKQMSRAQEILQLVPLDCVSFDMMEIQPITEYELYIRNFGSSNSEQVSTQVPDETEIDTTAIQTDEITMEDHVAQAPEDLGLSGKAVQPKGRGASRYRIDTAQLSAFMTNCSGVFRVLLDENMTALEGGVESQTCPFSRKTTTLKNNKFIGTERGTTGVVFSRVALQYMASIHESAKGEVSGFGEDTSVRDGLVLVWNVSNPSTPDKFCIAGGTITTATFSPYNGHLLYGGRYAPRFHSPTENRVSAPTDSLLSTSIFSKFFQLNHSHHSSNGSVYLWDLREPDHAHVHHKKSGTSSAILRTPTYSTDYMSGENHSCAIRRILPVGYNNILMGGMNDSDSSEQVYHPRFSPL